MTGVEPATVGVTGQYSDQLSYIPWWTIALVQLITGPARWSAVLSNGILGNRIFALAQGVRDTWVR